MIIGLTIYVKDLNEKKNRHVTFFDNHICFNSVGLFVSKKHKTGSYNVLYADIKRIRAVYLPILKFTRVYIKANNIAGEILITRYYKNYFDLLILVLCK